MFSMFSRLTYVSPNRSSLQARMAMFMSFVKIEEARP